MQKLKKKRLVKALAAVLTIYGVLVMADLAPSPSELWENFEG